MKKPLKRGDCINGVRPCPWVSCKYHLIWDAMTIKQEISARLITHKLMKMEETCALDVADKKTSTLEDIAKITGRTREGIRQIEGKKIFGREDRRQGAIARIRQVKKSQFKKLKEFVV